MVVPEPLEDSRFFEHGSVTLEGCEPKSRMAAVRICMPCCLFQTVTPHLLDSGTLDELKIRNPVAFWIPRLTSSRFVSSVASVPNIDARANAAIREEVDRIGKVFVHLQDYLLDPSDIIPILPLGTYVTFLYRCRIDSVMKLLEGIDNIKVVGVPEFQFSIASVLHMALKDFESVRIPLNKA